jgi:hypothetical protein
VPVDLYQRRLDRAALGADAAVGTGPIARDGRGASRGRGCTAAAPAAVTAATTSTLLPKQLEIEETSPEAAMSNEQIEEFYAFLSERMAAKAKLTIAPGPQTVN